MDERYDLVVIGAGPAGEKAASRAAYFGKHVLVVDRNPNPGGVAVSNAAIPTKTLRETAMYVTGFRKREIYGVSIELEPRARLERLMARRAQVTELMAGAVRRNLDRHGIDFVVGTARLRPGRVVEITDAAGDARTVAADVVLIATGSRPLHPPGIDFGDPDICDSETILEIDRIPERLVVVGGGAIGCEYASVFAALGVEVLLLSDRPRLLMFMDSEISELLQASFQDAGIRIETDRLVRGVARENGSLVVRTDEGAMRAEKVLFAGGRVGNTEDLGLEEVGVRIGEHGPIVVDEDFRTTADGIYAVGDVIGPPSLGSVSMEQGRVAVSRAFGISFQDPVDPLPPYGVYSIPEAAMVGMREEDARAQGIDAAAGRGWFASNARATIAGATDGLVKLVFAREDRRLLGVHILAEAASELIPVGQAVLHQGGSIEYFVHTTFNVPTWTEAYKYAAYDGLGRLQRGPLRA